MYENKAGSIELALHVPSSHHDQRFHVLVCDLLDIIFVSDDSELSEVLVQK